MPTVTWQGDLDALGLEERRRPRGDVVVETSAGPDRWLQEKGPFRSYERRLSVVADGADRYSVTERTSYALAIPLWGIVYDQLFRWVIKSHKREPRSRWWWPAEVVSAESATLIGVLGGLSIIAGYLGVLIGQVLTFATEDFGGSYQEQGLFFAALRIGVVAGVFLIRFADRLGRRPVLIGCAGGSILFTVLGGLTPNLELLWLCQAIARGLDTVLLSLIALAATEEVPAAVRATSIALQSMATALGAGMVVWVLPLADIGPGWWRVTFLAPAAFIPFLWWLARQLPETERFRRAAQSDAPARVDRYRFGLIASTAFLGGLFLSPASQLQNEFLRVKQGFSAGDISLFRLLVSTPAGLFLLGGAIIADRHGRKLLGSASLAVGTLAVVALYRASGSALWFWAVAETWVLAAAYPALRGYQDRALPNPRPSAGGRLD